MLLDGDPTCDATNLHKITAGVRGGRLLDRPALDAMQTRAAAAP